MALERFIQELIASTPDRRVEGKKRLQKLVYLLSIAGISSDANFFLKDYGPFSREIESAADIMSVFGDLLEKNITVGYNNYITTVYELPGEMDVKENVAMSNILAELEKYRSVELEVASTIQFFRNKGQSSAMAIDSTRSMKPSKSTDRVLAAADKILDFISKQNVSSAHP